VEETSEDACQASARKGPSIDDDGVLIYDSTVINEYLEER
jgi:glutathione S-transferase